MKNIYFIILIIIVISCKNEKQINYALVSGKITNIVDDSVKIRNILNKPIKNIPVLDEGSFADTIFNASGYYNLSFGNENTVIYLENGYNIHLELNTNEFDESLKYSGTGSPENNYLAQKFLLDEQLGNPKDLYTLGEKDFLSKVNNLKDNLQNNLSNTAIKETFKQLEKSNLSYGYSLKLEQYENYHSRFTNQRNFKVSDSFPKPLENESYDDEKAFSNSTAYQRLTYRNVFISAMNTAKKDSISFQNAAINKIKDIESSIIKNALLEQISYQVSIRNDKAEELYKTILALSTDEDFKKKLTKKFQSFSKLKKGVTSPIFTDYENFDGSKSSLTDYLGKFVYIDVWATWCAPCRAEIPALKKLNKSYKNNDIVFISISIDEKRAHQAWREMVKEKELTGVQLFADKDWKSSFIQEYGISAIPRFILIDKDGKIINTNAPRPSSLKLLTIFRELGI